MYECGMLSFHAKRQGSTVRSHNIACCTDIVSFVLVRALVCFSSLLILLGVMAASLAVIVKLTFVPFHMGGFAPMHILLRCRRSFRDPPRLDFPPVSGL